MKSKFNLFDYSQLTAVFLLVHSEMNAQVNYTDIEPDIVLDSNWESAGIDMDNNGTIDFAFLKRSETFTTYIAPSVYATLMYEILWVGPYIYSNKIAGSYTTNSGGWPSTHPYVLSNSEPINNNLFFGNQGYQLMAGKVEGTSQIIIISHAGNWWPEEVDKYLGVYFKDEIDKYHYGWIRLSVLDSAEVLVIKDYAYNEQPETGLLAGTLISGIEESKNNLDATIYSFDKNLYIKLNDYYNTKLIIENIAGEKIITKNLENEFESINMDLYPSGVYLVTLLQNEKRIDKKIFIR